MAEKNASKIKYFGKVLIDLTEDTVAPETLLKGVTAHDKTGAQITGTAVLPVRETISYATLDGSSVSEQVEVNEKMYETWVFTLESDETVTKTTDAITKGIAWNLVTEFTIPEGEVKLITRVSNGSVIWDKYFEPTVEITEFTGYMTGASPTLIWAVKDVPSGYAAYTIGLSYYTAETTTIEPAWTETVVWENEKREDMSYTRTPAPSAEKNVIYYKIIVGIYSGADDAIGDYVRRIEVASPRYVCSGNSIYTLAPYMLPCTVTDGIAAINWGVLSAAVYTSGVELQYAYNGNNLWYDIVTEYDETVNSYAYDISTKGWTSVAFRICAFSTRSKNETSYYDYTPWISLT